jgi:hypothetical protein
MGLGPFHTISLAKAREKAEVCRAMRLKGLDPLDERHREQQAKVVEAAETIIFEKCAESYIIANKDGWKNGTHAGRVRPRLHLAFAAGSNIFSTGPVS